ncbi:hypothetical protein ACL6C3_14800 [Capilliphycus salinus ALCB114379]|uniref:hypothetical protein n=1 Tax=Capilliphycus salinus TaxID=2768948 RepID=UPI0039A55A63
MKLWIVTIGSSDVQLQSDKYNRENGRNQKKYSNQIWSYWYGDIKPDCYDISFDPTKTALKDVEETYRIQSRVLGTVYEENSAEIQDEIRSYLTFPLLSNFIRKLRGLGVPDVIVYLLTDQSAIFDTDEKRRKIKSPYWEDTCKLEPILQGYFEHNFPGVKLISLKLSPTQEPGLDDWDKVLDLVKNQLNTIQLDSEPNIVYVSHQAGTPAISSAVQFMSLARFRNHVTFLVSNEYTEETKTIPNSTYLGAIQRQEAIALLEQYDYVGVRDILGLSKVDSDNHQAKQIKYLLDAAEQWNCAKFQKFKKTLKDRKLLDIKEFPWYQSGYESAYLAWIRLQQGSTVDAMFHSFRAVEGSITKWVEKYYNAHIFKNPKYGPQVKLSIRQELPGYFNALSQSTQEKFKKDGNIGLYGEQLYKLLKQARPEWNTHPDIKVVLEDTKKDRNNLFHRLEGLQESELFEAWNTKTPEAWEKRLLGCMNFIAQKDLAKPFSSLEKASLMAQVHEKLKQFIETY